MANTIQVKRSAVPAKVPTTSDLALGEIAVNTYDGKMYIKKDDGTPSIVQIGAGGGGSGDVVGPGSATDNAITRFDGTTGKLIQNSTVTLSDTGALSGVTSITTPDYITYDTTATGVSITPGVTTWNDGEGVLDVGLKGGNVTLNVGTQEYARVYNDSGTTLTKGQVVYISGAQGNRVAVKLARADVEATSFGTLGLVAETITNGAEGFIIVSGALYKLNTTGLTAGGTVYLSPTTAGAYTQTKPQAPDQLVVLGWVERVDNIVGSIYIKIDNGYELDELHDVQVTSPTSGNLLIYDASTSPIGVWKNASLTAGTGISVSNGAGSVTVTNSAPDQTVALTGAGTTTVTGTYPNFTITSNDQYTGTVTSVAALTLGTSGTDLSSTVANGTTTPVITLNVPTASATNRGALSSADWTTFNSKAPATSGTSILYGDGSGGFSNVTVGTGLSFTAGTLTATGGGNTFSPYQFIATASQTTFAVGVTLSVIQVFVSGVLQKPTADYTVSGTNVVLTTGVDSGTIVSVYVYDTFNVANTYTQSAADALFAPQSSPTFTGTLSAATINASGSISDSKGDVRSAPINSQSGAYVLLSSDAGKTISITTGGVTVNASVFNAGDMVTIFNNSASSQNITQGASVTLRLTGTATTGTRALAQYGIATLLCVVGGATPTFACTGSGLT